MTRQLLNFTTTTIGNIAVKFGLHLAKNGRCGEIRQTYAAEFGLSRQCSLEPGAGDAFVLNCTVYSNTPTSFDAGKIA
jgi:hypothetical protein